MDSEFFQVVMTKVEEAIGGKGVLPTNRACYRITEDIYLEFRISRADLVNEIMCFLIEENILDKYDPEGSLGWFLVNVSWRWLSNRLYGLRAEQKRYRRMVARIKKEAEDDEYFLPNYGNPEELYFHRERFEIIRKHATDDEIDLLSDKISVSDYAKEHGMAYKLAWQHKKRLSDKLLIILHKSGYDKIF